MNSKVVKILFLVMGIGVFFPALAQDSDTSKNYIASEVADSSLKVKKSEWQFEFKHIDKKYAYRDPGIKGKVYKGYYRNEDKLKHIAKLEALGEKDPLIHALEDYVRHFSIQNFYRNTEMLWKLAQLHELKKDTEKAKFFYRLALKHHSKGKKNEVEQFFKYKDHYDDMTELERDNYVPLEYYYELVEYRKAVDTLRPPRSVLINMGEDINEKNVADYGPALSGNGTVLIFTKRKIDKRTVNTMTDPSSPNHNVHYNEDLYFVKGYGENYWGKFEKFDIPINSQCNEGSACLSKDGKTLVFGRCETKYGSYDCRECMGSCDLYISTLKDDSTWSHPVNMGENVNSVYWESHPTFSPSEDTLYFASHRPDGFGLSDIYYTHKQRDGTWSKAKNLGPTINTRYNEDSPFVHPKYNVLYFSSSGHLLNFDDIKKTNPVPSLDLYKSYYVEGKWQEPKNLGPLVNGKGHELYFTIDVNSKFLYYAKTEKGFEKKDINMTDLFSFPLPMEAQPTATITLAGMLVDEETGDPLEAIVSVIDLDNGIEVAPKNVRKDGSYEFDLIDKNNYLLVIQGDDFFRIEKLFYLDGDTLIKSEATKIQNKKLKFQSVVFENGKSEILDDMKEDLKKVVDFLLDNPKFDLTIAGHTDSDGNEDFNKKLSQKRADAIREYVMDEGSIDGTRIKAIGYGSDKPIKSPEVTEEDKSINRRVEFEIYYDETNFTDDDFTDDDEPVDDSDW